MAWMEPKTDWVSTDYFNAEDYNRIIGNISYLKTLADELFVHVTDVSLGEEKTHLSMIYAREMNVIETSLETLNLETYSFDVGETKEYKANSSTPLWSEYNRIESAILLLYNTMTAHKAALTKLDFRLGNQKGLKV